jgi:hypothetical protein
LHVPKSFGPPRHQGIIDVDSDAHGHFLRQVGILRYFRVERSYAVGPKPEANAWLAQFGNLKARRKRDGSSTASNMILASCAASNKREAACVRAKG